MGCGAEPIQSVGSPSLQAQPQVRLTRFATCIYADIAILEIRLRGREGGEIPLILPQTPTAFRPRAIEATTMSSLILRSRSSLTPEMRLVKATSEFEAALTTAQKASFRNIRSKACTTPPTLKDVMELTAEIDCQAHKKHKSSRSFGTRLTNMLQSVQQYAALGDVVVGGSQNLIACGVWAAVRMILHVRAY